MTFCFSFEVLSKLNPMQANIEGGGPSNKKSQGGGMDFPISEVKVYQYFFFYSFFNSSFKPVVLF